ncbi:uncharacterized protein LOC132724338 isoform X2 [Ruditapes philippinarum]|uniref:uncharacterized protein LOC132724338 isoform X2 n=1 Tax=Ruditapes philippinarum TaxID=129788 RepID=UPI00295BB509|nr:uncharacterized protein LOC132724338 isoform X2 [Ruditapes philippinarum]
MQFFGVLILAGMLCISFTLEEKIFRIESHKKGKENVLIIKERTTGKRVTEIDVFENDGYQLGKPEDENSCLVSRFLIRSADSPTCFKRINAPKDMQEELSIDLTECGDRDIVFLEPTNCRKTDTDMDREPSNGLRQKRAALGCFIVEEIVSYCKRHVNVCIRPLWGKCRKYITECAERGTKLATITNC